MMDDIPDINRDPNPDPELDHALPCPFRHFWKASKLVIKETEIAGLNVCQVRCMCGASGPNANNRMDAVKEWNQR